MGGGRGGKKAIWSGISLTNLSSERSFLFHTEHANGFLQFLLPSFLSSSDEVQWLSQLFNWNITSSGMRKSSNGNSGLKKKCVEEV